jgi:hypothetical protein
VTDFLATSERLHERVRRFALGQSGESFTALAWDIACFQRRAIACTRTLWGLLPFAPLGATEGPLELIPAVPVEALRSRAVFAFEVTRAAAVFRTSGTTSAETGRHLFRTTRSYEAITLATGRAQLLPHTQSALVAALLPFAPPGTHSSLSFMAQRFMDEFDGPGTATNGARWLVEDAGIDVEGLGRLVQQAEREGRSVLLLATSFALLALLEGLHEPLPFPAGSVVMPTGGFKGRTRSVDPEWLRQETQRKLGPVTVVHEYGMTELSSQLYERTASQPGAEPGTYYEAPTIRVIPVDPVTLHAVPDGQIGLASFVDLGNVDSAVRILTQDRVVRENGGIRLLGRSEQAPLRGCALTAESLVLREPLATRPPEIRERLEDPGARDRVRRLVAAARVLADPSSAEGRRLRSDLVANGPLSPEGVEFGLRNSLETDPSDEELDSLVASVEPVGRVWVVQSANVFVAAHRAIALALASSSDVRVRPSRRDPALARALHALAPDLFEIVDDIAPRPGDHVHAYGSDATLATIARELPSGVALKGHGDGIGVAFISSDFDLREFARDVAAFDQRGCASPRVVALAESIALQPFLDALGAALVAAERELPRGLLSADEQAAVTHFRVLALVCADRVHGFGESIVAVQHEDERVLLPPVGRNLVLMTGSGALDRLARSASQITTVGIAGDADTFATVAALFPRARHCRLGQMQRPPFDGPLDLR